MESLQLRDNYNNATNIIRTRDINNSSSSAFDIANLEFEVVPKAGRKQPKQALQCCYHPVIRGKFGVEL